MDIAIETFNNEKTERIQSYSKNNSLKEAAEKFNLESNKCQYSYNFTWMGRPIIQYPQDMIAMQEIIWEIKPDLIIETGIAHGGSLVYYASILELIGKGEVIGIDIDIRAHNKKMILEHPMIRRIKMIEGSSVSADIFNQVEKLAKDNKTVMVCLDSNHTHEHVLQELNLYGKLVSKGSYMVVFDTIVEYLPDNYLPGRPWKKSDNPKSAVDEFLKQNNHFTIQDNIDNKLLISVAPGGYLKRIK
jgi:cephalosporin hydroxylase